MSSSSTNMYRVGDYVYFETASTSPFQVRRIEELNKTVTGNVEAKVMCFFRRRDLPQSLTFLADRHQSALEEEGLGLGIPGGLGSGPKDKDAFSPKERHLLQHRELFLSRQVETLPATLIRGKCSVTLLNETESLESYLNRDDTFFYSLVYDPQQKTLLADKGEIRVGSRYQAETPKGTLAFEDGETDGRDVGQLESLVWTPGHGLTDKQIDQFLVLSRSVGTFARALDCSSSVKQPSLHMSAAAASRDVTLFHAMNTLHKSNYDISRAVSALVPSSGPLLCRDELEEWSASEANLFEEALDKYGKDFNDIRSDYLPWKTGKNLVEYYYMWKTTDRYVQQKRVKAAEAETKLKQVYIPNYNKPNASGTGMSGGSKGQNLNGASTPTHERDQPLISGKPCESCLQTSSVQWYAWTGSSGIQARLCNTCWHYWRKYGGLKVPNKMLDGAEMEVKKVLGTGMSMSTGIGMGITMGISGQTQSGGHGLGHGIGHSSAHGHAQIQSGPKSEPSLSDTENENGGTGSTVVVEKQTIQLPPGLIQQRFHRCAVQGCGKDFKMKNQLARHYATAHGFPMRQGSPRPVMKTRTAFYLHTTPMTRVARRLCSPSTLKPRKASRSPFWPINSALIKQECQQGVIGKSPEELRRLVTNRRRKMPNPKVADVSYRLGQLDRSIPAWLVLTEKSKIPKPVKEAWPKPPKGPDGSLIYERVPEKFFAPFNVGIGGDSTGILGSTPPKKRGFDEINGIEIPVPSKRDRGHGHHGHSGGTWSMDSSSSLLPRELGGSGSSGTGGVNAGLGSLSPIQQIPILPTASLPGPVRNLVNHVNGARAKIATVTRVGSRKQIISWMDAPDDLYFYTNEHSKKLRRTLTPSELRRLARSPCKKALLKGEIIPIPIIPGIVIPGAGGSSGPMGLSVPRQLQPQQPIPHTALSVANLTSSVSPGSGHGQAWSPPPLNPPRPSQQQ